MDYLCFSVLFCYAFMHVCLLMPCGHLLGKGLTPWLSFVMSCNVVTFPLFIDKKSYGDVLTWGRYCYLFIRMQPHA